MSERIKLISKILILCVACLATIVLIVNIIVYFIKGTT